MGLLKAIEVENYKSYKGKQLIGPFKNFSAIIGPNGSGKSNLMDAICFVLGEKTQSLRVRKISDLIHGSPIGAPVSNKCHVTLIYEEEDGTETAFTRTVTTSGAEYRINGRTCSMSDYVAKLEAINIFVKAKNFLVPQGTVESITTKSPKERTALFEEISRSGELREEYERRKTEMDQAEEDTQFNYQKKRGIAAERKEAKQEQDEAVKYQKMRQDWVDGQVQLHLFRLYHNERDIDQITEDTKTRQKDLDRTQSRRDKLDEELRDKKKDQGKLTKEITKLDQQIHELQISIQKKTPAFMKAKKTKDHTVTKISATEKSLALAQSAFERHAETIKRLQRDLEVVQTQRKLFMEELEAESQSKGLQLNEDQINQYKQLKEGVFKEVSSIQVELDGIEREQKLDNDVLANERRKKDELSNKISQKEKEYEDTLKRVERFNDLITRDEAEATRQAEALEVLQAETATVQTRLEEIHRELEGINSQLSDARADSSESSRQQKKTELVETLKRLFPGVHGRLVDMCQPSHKRYQLAITKVLGKNMVAIIVDAEKTARECIQYMKEQRAEPETFLPLDYLSVKPINERLRELREPKGAKLLIDVIQYDPPQIKKALQYACTNAIVCENAEDARSLAFGGSERHKAVSLDGTLFQKSGIISGGASDLKNKARRWDEKAVTGLRSKREKLLEEQKEKHRIRRKGSEIPVMQSSLHSLKQRLKYEKTDRDSAEQRQTKQLEKDLQQFKAEIDGFEPRIQEIEQRMEHRGKKISNLRDGMNKVEDRIFGDFCTLIGVANIRQYEDREIEFDKNRRIKMMEYENQIEKLEGQLEFENSNDKKAMQTKLDDQLEREKKQLKADEMEEQKQLKSLNEETKKLEEVKMKKITFKSQTDDFEGEVNEIKKRQQAAQKELHTIQKQMTTMESRLEQKKSDRHSLLQACKMEDIDLPLTEGTLHDVGNLNDNSDISSQESSSQAGAASQDSQQSSQAARMVFERESRIKVNYDRLNDDYKDLDSDDEVKKIGEKLTKEVSELQLRLGRITAPNLKANERLESVKDRFKDTTEEFENARKKAKKAKMAFEKVKKERCDAFNSCYEKVAENIDDIYKQLSRNPSAQAVLQAQNNEEPYLDGLKYECVAPGKRFRPMDNLSGGEKTIAALALLFAIHSVNPAPFFVLDEIDAALDNTNIGKVAAFIREQSRKMQVIVISLKEEFYNRGDALIGIYPVAGPCVESGVLTLDLTAYKDPNTEERQNA